MIHRKSRTAATLAALLALLCLTATATAASSSSTTKAKATKTDPPPDPVFSHSQTDVALMTWARYVQTTYPVSTWHVVSTTLDATHYDPDWSYLGDYDHIHLYGNAWAATLTGSWEWQSVGNATGSATCWRTTAAISNKYWKTPNADGTHDAWINVVPGEGYACHLQTTGAPRILQS